jgi:hypothetical protein
MATAELEKAKEAISISDLKDIVGSKPRDHRLWA